MKVLGQGSVNSLTGYKYIYLAPLTYQDGSSDRLGFRNEVKKKLLASGIDVIETKPLPSGVDECLVSSCFIEHTNNEGQATSDYIYLKFYNCRKELIYTSQGATGAVVWTLKQGRKKALREALSDFDSYKYKFDESKTVEASTIRNLPNVESTGETETSIIEYFDKNIIDEIEGIYKSYQSEQLGYYKIGIKKYGSKYKAIIIESDLKYWKTGEVKAVFETSSMKGFYSTKWYMGNKTPFETFALLENSALLSVELKDATTGEKRTGKFIKMYPSTNVNTTTTINGIKATGSGFVISTDGIIATNAHVIEGADRIEISLQNEFGSKTYTVTVLLKDESNDVALLKIEDAEFKGFNTLPFSILQTTEIGEDVFTIGYPMSSLMGDNYKVTNGIVSSNTGLKDDVRFIQITTPIQPGNSGGPLFNKDGNVVGLTTSKLNEKAVGTSMENVNYAIKATYLINIYNMLPNKKQLTSNSPLSNKELKEQVKVLKNYVCLIKVY